MFVEEFEGLLARSGGEDVVEPDLVEERLGNPEIHRHVIDDEDADCLRIASKGLGLGLGLSLVRLDGLGTVAHGIEHERERTSLADPTGAGQFTVHAGCQALGDGESETGAVVHCIGATLLLNSSLILFSIASALRLAAA